MTPAFCSSTWRLAAWDQMIFQNANELPTRRHNNMQKWNDTLKSKSLQHLPQLHRMFWDVLNAIHNPIFVVLVASLCLWSCKCLLGQSQTLAVQGMATALAETLDNIRPWLLKPYKSYKIITFLLLKFLKSSWNSTRPKLGTPTLLQCLVFGHQVHLLCSAHGHHAFHLLSKCTIPVGWTSTIGKHQRRPSEQDEIRPPPPSWLGNLYKKFSKTFFVALLWDLFADFSI